MEVRAHKLFYSEGAQVPFIRSPNQSRGSIKPRFLVMHYTAGASASSSINWLTAPNARASVHLVIARDGSITQLVDFNRRAWHAGKSTWRGVTGLNSHSIGIELDNPGVLQGSPGNWTTSWGNAVSDTDVLVFQNPNNGSITGWYKYTQIQLEVAREVTMLLTRHYDLEEIVGHSDIAPGRKQDPGAAFPMASFQSMVAGRESDDVDQTFKATANLNIRKGPGTEYEKFSDVSPLPKGTRLDVLQSEGIWRKVDVLDTVNGEMDIVGWVHGRYLV